MLHIFSSKTITKLTQTRIGETKLGETIQIIKNNKKYIDELQNNNATFVIVGVPEDIGVKMNYGNGGAHTAFIPALKALLNTQENQFISGKDILILGYLDVFNTVLHFDASDREKGNLALQEIDQELSKLIQLIIETNKIPIIIGGGHNNAYGNLKGLSLAKRDTVNVINFDAHSDLRKLEERHSGNGFSYALKHQFINKYFIFGLHENYTPQYIFDTILSNINIEYNTFEELMVYKTTSFKTELQRAKNFIQEKPFGIEIDLDAIANFPSSAISPTGFSTQQARQFIHYLSNLKNASYLHICEAAPTMFKEETTLVLVGKFISYLITDFIKAKTSLSTF